MKTLIFTGCFWIMTSMAALAQLPSFTFGIKGGANFSSLKSAKDLTDENSIIGYQAGIFARLGGAGVYLQPELYLGSKGSKFVSVTAPGGTSVAAEGKVKFTTLDLPLLLGTKIGPNKLNLRFMAGPVVSFIIDENTDFAAAYDKITGFEDYKDQSFALQAGTGVDLGSLTVDLRYEAGLSNMIKNENYKQKQNLFHVSLGLKLL